MCTSDILLRQFSKTRDEKVKELVTASSKFDQLLKLATPDRRAVLEGLSKQLELKGDDRAAAARTLADSIDKQRKSLDQKQGRGREEIPELRSLPVHQLERDLRQPHPDDGVQHDARDAEDAGQGIGLGLVADDLGQAVQVIDNLEGNLTGSLYSDTHGSDDAAYDELAPRLRQRAGRLLNDKMPTGVAVSPAMNHGGPYPATGHPGFTAVGIPAALRRFAVLQCYDNVRAGRLPPALRD